MRVFLISGYHSGSHRSWADGYIASSRHDVHLVSLPGRFWQWRMSGGFVTLADGVVELAQRVGVPDLILATSMVDVAGLRGLVEPRVGALPTALYMHENQVTYPATGRTKVEQSRGLTTWTSLLAADAVAFNSRFHLDSLLEALPPFLRSFPDESHEGLVERVAAKATVLPVGCSLRSLHTGPKTSPPLVLWNHRWDTDKAPGEFLSLVSDLADSGLQFAVALAGERFVDQRPDHEGAVQALGDRVVIDGYLSRDEYEAVLAAASLVVSTAAQEFFGISVVEAMHAGAFPVLPDRLVYRERIPEPLHERCLYRSHDHAVDLLRQAIIEEGMRKETAAMLTATTGGFDWSVVGPAYDDWLESITAS